MTCRAQVFRELLAHEEAEHVGSMGEQCVALEHPMAGKILSVIDLFGIYL